MRQLTEMVLAGSLFLVGLLCGCLLWQEWGAMRARQLTYEDRTQRMERTLNEIMGVK